MYRAKVVASTNNIPTTFDTSAGSLIFTAPSAGLLEIINTTNSVLIVAQTSHPTTVPSNSDSKGQNYIPAAPTSGSAGWVKDGFIVTLGDKIYLRSDSGSAVTTGSVYFNLL